MSEHEYLERALALARRGLFTAHPNPRVGCVIVRGGEIVGEGWHRAAGEAHAEAHALAAAGARARGATAYVSLEPCCHHGRTPPCTEALIRAGVARVVAAGRDPDPRVAGRGFERLRAAGVAAGTPGSPRLARAAADLNPGFFKRAAAGRPFVRLKLAMSLDGRTALPGGESRWITGREARRDVQRWRARADALLTGIGTVLADDPRLTVRPAELDLEDTGAGPEAPPDPSRLLRVVLDSRLRTPPTAALFASPAPVLVAAAGAAEEAGGERAAALRAAGAEVAAPAEAGIPGRESPRAADPRASPRADPGGGAFPPAELGASLPSGREAPRPPGSESSFPRPPGRPAARPAAPPVHRAEAGSRPVDLPALLRLLGAREINEAHVECGPTLAGALLAAGHVDELLLYCAPTLLGNASRPLFALPAPPDMGSRPELEIIDVKRLGGDVRLRAAVRRPAPLC